MDRGTHPHQRRPGCVLCFLCGCEAFGGITGRQSGNKVACVPVLQTIECMPQLLLIGRLLQSALLAPREYATCCRQGGGGPVRQQPEDRAPLCDGRQWS